MTDAIRTLVNPIGLFVVLGVTYVLSRSLRAAILTDDGMFRQQGPGDGA